MLVWVGGGGIEAGRLRAPGFGSGAEHATSAPAWNGHAGRPCSGVSASHLAYYRTLVVSKLPHPGYLLYLCFIPSSRLPYSLSDDTVISVS